MKPIDRKEVVQKGGLRTTGQHSDRAETNLSIFHLISLSMDYEQCE